MPKYVMTGAARRILTDPNVRARSGWCAETIGDVIGRHLGNANQWPAKLPGIGYQEVGSGGVRPGDIVVWDRYDKDPNGHIGIAVADEKTGELGFASNFMGHRVIRSLKPGYRAFRGPDSGQVAQYDWSPMQRSRLSSAVSELRSTIPEPPAAEPRPPTDPFADFVPGIPEIPQPGDKPIGLGDLAEKLLYPPGSDQTPEQMQRGTDLAKFFLDPSAEDVDPKQREETTWALQQPLLASQAPGRFLSLVLKDALLPEAQKDAVESPSVGARALQSIMPLAPTEDYSFSSMAQDVMGQMDMASMPVAERWLTKAILFSGGFVGDVVTDPLSWVGVGKHALSPNTWERLAGGAASKAIVPEVARLGLDVGDTQTFMRGELRRMRQTDVFSKIDAGGVQADEIAQRLGDAVARRAKAGKVELSTGNVLRARQEIPAAEARTLGRKYVASVREMRARPYSVVVPFTSFGYPLPGTTALRDRARLAVGMRGLEFRPASDPEFLLKRRSVTDRVRLLTGSDPLVPFGDAEEAFTYPLVRRYHQTYAKEAERLGQMSSNQWEGAIDEWYRKQKAAVDDAAERGITMELPELTGEDLRSAIVDTMAHRFALERLSDPHASAVLRSIKEQVAPWTAMPQHMQEALLRMHNTKTAMGARGHSRVEAMLHGISDQESMGIWQYSNTKSGLGDEVSHLNRLRDLLEATDELPALGVGSIEAERDALRRFVVFDDAGNMMVNKRSLAKVVPRAAHLATVWEKEIQPFFEDLFKVNKSRGKRLRTMGIPVRDFGHLEDYTPLRVSKAMDAQMDDFKLGSVAVTPEARQGFTKERKLGHGMDLLFNDTLKRIKSGERIEHQVMDMRLLMHIYVAESSQMALAHDMYTMVKRYGVAVTDPRAVQFALAGWTPMPRSSTLMNLMDPTQTAKLTDATVETVDKLAKLNERLAGRTAKRVAAEEKLRTAEAAERTSRQSGDRALSNQLRTQEPNVTSPSADIKWRDVTGGEPVKVGKDGNQAWQAYGKQAAVKAGTEAEIRGRFAGTMTGFERLGKQLTPDAFYEAYFIQHYVEGEAQEQMMRSWAARYKVQRREMRYSPRAGKPMPVPVGAREDIVEYVNEWGKDMVEGWDWPRQMHGPPTGEEAEGFAEFMKSRFPDWVEQQGAYHLNSAVERQRLARADAIAEELRRLPHDYQVERRAVRAAFPSAAERDAALADLDQFYATERQSLLDESDAILPEGIPKPIVREGERAAAKVETAAGRYGKARQAERKALAAAPRQRAEISAMGGRFDGRAFDPFMGDRLLPPGVTRQFIKTLTQTTAGPVSAWVSKNLFNYARGNVLVSASFHLMNAIDNWVVGRWLAGQVLLFGDEQLEAQGKSGLRRVAEAFSPSRVADAMNPLRNGATAMRSIIATHMVDMAGADPVARLGWIQRQSKQVLEMVGKGMDPEKIAKYGKEIRAQDVLEHGVLASVERAPWGPGKAAVTTGEKVVAGLKAPGRAWQAVMQANRHVGMVLEDIPRVATYITAREKGYSVQEAKRLVDASFVNYRRDISSGFHDFMRSWTMFWPYTFNRSRQMIQAFAARPGMFVQQQALSDRERGGAARLSTPLGDVPLSLLPDAPQGQAKWLPSQRYLFDHALKGRFGYLAGDYEPIFIPRDEQGKISGPWAGLLNKVTATDTMEGAYALLNKNRNGTHYTFMRTGNSIKQLTAALMQLGMAGDIEQVTNLGNPVVQAGLDAVTAARSGQPAGVALKRSLTRNVVGAYVPLGRFATPFLASSNVKVPQKPTEASVRRYNLQKAYDDDFRKLRQTQGMLAMAERFTVVPEEKLVETLNDREKARYYQLLRQESFR